MLGLAFLFLAMYIRVHLMVVCFGFRSEWFPCLDSSLACNPSHADNSLASTIHRTLFGPSRFLLCSSSPWILFRCREKSCSCWLKLPVVLSLPSFFLFLFNVEISPSTDLSPTPSVFSGALAHALLTRELAGCQTATRPLIAPTHRLFSIERASWRYSARAVCQREVHALWRLFCRLILLMLMPWRHQTLIIDALLGFLSKLFFANHYISLGNCGNFINFFEFDLI